jgi:YYY domain-containing protein
LRKQAGAPAVAVAVPGLAAAAFVVAGNLAGAVDYLDHPGRLADFNWFAPSRVIPNTANEFPFFSFLLGDLHAHLLAPPFALIALAYTMQICLTGPRRIRRRQVSSWALAAAELLLAALVLGALYAVNSLDYPTAVLIAIFAVLLWLLAEPRTWVSTLVWAVLWIGGSVLLFLPFWTRFDPMTNGVGLVGDRTHFSEFLKDEFLIYGLLFWVVATLLARRRVPVRYLVWGGTAAAVVLVLLSPSRLASVLLSLSVIGCTLFVALAGERPQAERFVWLLVAAGIALIGIGEFVYIRDSFEGTPSFRFNTIFKAGYQAWFLLSVVAGCVLVWNRAWLRGWLGRFWRVGFACLGVLVLIYPVVGSYARGGGFDHSPTLDGMAWLEKRSPGDVASIRWLRSHAPASSTLLEGVGPDFDPSGAGRVSTFTGLATVLGWAGHEIQWGHTPDRRIQDVRRLYRTNDIAQARRLLALYGVDYVFVGSLERRDYPPHALAKFRRMGRVVFSHDGTVVYRVRGQEDPSPSARPS